MRGLRCFLSLCLSLGALSLPVSGMEELGDNVILVDPGSAGLSSSHTLSPEYGAYHALAGYGVGWFAGTNPAWVRVEQDSAVRANRLRIGRSSFMSPYNVALSRVVLEGSADGQFFDTVLDTTAFSSLGWGESAVVPFGALSYRIWRVTVHGDGETPMIGVISLHYVNDGTDGGDDGGDDPAPVEPGEWDAESVIAALGELSLRLDRLLVQGEVNAARVDGLRGDIESARDVTSGFLPYVKVGVLLLMWGVGTATAEMVVGWIMGRRLF